MIGLSQIRGALRRQREAARQRRVLAEAEAGVLLSRGSRRQALDDLRHRESAAGADPAMRRKIAEVREAVFRLTGGETRVDTATRMLYRDEL